MHFRLCFQGRKQPFTGRQAMRICMGGVLLVMVVAGGGCCITDAVRSTLAPYEAIKERKVITWQAGREARQVWKDRFEACYTSNPCLEDVRKGFEEAYIETALGLGSCPPPVPKRRVLGLLAINRSYPAAAPWYEGYSLGHASAVANGVDRWRLAPLNPQLMLAVRQCQCNQLVDVEPSHEAIEPSHEAIEPSHEAVEPSHEVIEPLMIESEPLLENAVEELPAADALTPLLIEID